MNSKITYFGNTDLLSLGEMVRYNNHAKIKNENVATHTFIAATNIFKICHKFNIPQAVKLLALEMVIVHDIGELATNDIPHNFKKANPELKKMLEVAELQFMKESMPEFYQSFERLIRMEKAETLIAVIVKLADTISVLQYSNNELDLGNKTPKMVEINEDAKRRVLILINKLEEKILEFNEDMAKREAEKANN
ncbi:YfbR-like 5'-deoxynucleotidase [Priestia megaterium]|uniref:YfbR-like 5'-deoxynucleotidase n=1 Tax=Priestia megaterium TaxID=1404 RepID=UPI000BEE4A2F|nr:YfbR-like 5'-deoxynucleotidase [Priestia megaterium]PED64022.1 hypothetical protein CON20_23960 [Priestia megaterium]